MQLEPLSAAALLAKSGCGTAAEVVGAFQHAPNEKVVFGPGVLALAGAHVGSLGVRRVLVVTDPGIAAAGHLGHLSSILRQADLEVHAFAEVAENPTTEVVAKCVEAARACQAEALIGLGGGSSMDAAKGCNFILTNGGEMKDYWGIGKATKPMLPFIAIPTTAGTGSECQSFALISDPVTHVKMACGDKKAAARIAILDPELTITQPPLVTRHTGIDALTHALESAVSRKAGEISKAYSRAAFSLLASGFPAVLSEPSNLTARAKMLLGAALAGAAIENSMLGAAHSCANPLTARFDVVHGEAVGVMMPAVLELNMADEAAAKEYEALAAIIKISAQDLPGWFSNELKDAGVPMSLRHYGITAGDIPALAAEAATQWTAQFNPVAVDVGAFERLYSVAL